MRKVFGAVLLLLTVLLSAVSLHTAAALPSVSDDAARTKSASDGGTKVLFIGNSHTRDSTAYLYGIAAAAGYEEMIIGRAYINGASLKTHESNLETNQPVYTYKKSSKNAKEETITTSLPAVVTNERWDVIVIQERSGSAGDSVADSSHIPSLISGLRMIVQNPDVRFGWFMPWAYASDYSGFDFEGYGNDQEKMYAAIASTAQYDIPVFSEIGFIIPVGTALQNARSSYLGDTFNSDGNHLAPPSGMYLAALCHFRSLVGQPLSNWQTMIGSYTALPQEEWPLYRDAVERAISSPYHTTRSAYEQPSAAPYYSLFFEEISISPVSAYIYYTGEPKTPDLLVQHGAKVLRQGVDYTLSYKNNIDPGLASITLSGIGYYTGMVNIPFVIAEPPLDDLTISDIAPIQYTGSPILPDFTVQNGGGILVPDRDYTVMYENNLDAGTARIILTGVGNYSGTVEKTFEILPRSLQKLTYADIPDQIFAEGYITPAPSIKFGDIVLIPDVDYTFRYQDNYKIGPAMILIEGIGNYTGTAEMDFHIVACEAENLTVTEFSPVTYNGKSRKALPKVWNGAVRLKNGTDYTLSYENNRYAGTATVIIKLKGNYEGVLTQDFTIKPKSIKTLTYEDIPAQKYTGKAKTPNPVIRMNSRLKKGRDYTVTYKSNVKRGTATITIRGIGNFTGTVKKTFIIE